MKRIPHRAFINLSASSLHALSSAAKLTLMLLCSLLLASNALAQETRPDESLPVAPQRAERESAPKRDTVPPANSKLHLNGVSATTANQVVDGDIIFTSPGQFTYPRDIKLSDNYGGLRFIGAPSLTVTPDGAAIQFFGNNATPYNGQLYLDSGAFNSAALIFRTAQTGGTITERMRVTSNGKVGIGTDNPIIGRLHVDGGISDGIYGVSSGAGIGVYGNSSSGYGVFGQSDSSYGVYGFSYGGGYGVYGKSTTTSAAIYGYNLNGGYAGYFVGNVYTTGVLTQNSDARLKRDVTRLSYGLREVLLLRPVSWVWKAKNDGAVNLGLIAQEVEPLLPELVSTGIDAEHTKGLNYIGLIPVLVKGVQEQQTQIEQQQKQLQQQQAVIEGLRKIVCRQNRRADVCKGK